MTDIVSVGYLRHLADIAPREQDRRHFAAAADEIERLRAENEALNAMFHKRRNLAIQFADERDDLQSLIDAYAAANAEYGEPQQFLDAKHALLAAATPKEDAP